MAGTEALESKEQDNPWAGGCQSAGRAVPTMLMRAGWRRGIYCVSGGG